MAVKILKSFEDKQKRSFATLRMTLVRNVIREAGFDYV